MSIKTSLKWLAVTGTTIFLGIVALIVYLFVQINSIASGSSSLKTLSSNENSIVLPKKSPWRNDETQAKKRIRNTNFFKEKKTKAKAPAKANAEFVTEKSQFINSQLAIFSSEIRKVHLCQIQCRDLEAFVSRTKQYWKGKFAFKDPPEEDPAYQLAVITMQAGFGSSGKRFFSILKYFTDNPFTIKALGDIFWLASEVGELKEEFDRRGKTRGLEADDLVAFLLETSKSCSASSWARACHNIEEDVVFWFNGSTLD